ncbi:ninjurin-2-like [Limulus polyphemus]|uniref:Ninjurin-2-like n=1 Tax=Limulus polyphemus TaxID=6850 RepID=A0ABM1SKW8_LIMPO|nr:ninjurin-2-like [Limulus polyphemus]
MAYTNEMINIPLDELHVSYAGRQNSNDPPAEGPRQAFSSNSEPVATEDNGNKPQVESQKSGRLLDHNAYATKKTVGQGMLDIALLTTNVSQLKYLLQVGKKHEFYYLLITLVSVSIFLQIFVGALFIIIARMNVNEEKSQGKANILNNIITGAVSVITAINIVSSAFNMKSTDDDVEP